MAPETREPPDDDASGTGRETRPDTRRDAGHDDGRESIRDDADDAGRGGSVRRKLLWVVFTTTGVALLIAAAGMLAYDVRVSRLAFMADRATEAEMLAIATAPALAFDDVESARPNLDALRARTSILTAALYDASGRLFVSYVAPGADPAPPGLAAATTPAPPTIVVERPVVRGGERLGTVVVHARYDLVPRLATYLGISALVTACALALALVLSRRLHRSITRPLDSMTRVARAIARDRDYSLRASGRSDDEFDVLVDAFNTMLAEVESRAQALERAVQERTRAEHALLQADRRKDEFLATLAHELRNPLAPVRNAVRVLQAAHLPDSQRAWARQVIERQVGRMALLLDDLLDVSRITRGVLTIKPVPVGLASLFHTAIETAQPLVVAKQHTLEVAEPGADVKLCVDPLRLSQAISNLLTNAAKYTDAGGRIRLWAEVDAHGARIFVEDDGIGLEPAAIPRLFEMFTQVRSSLDRADGGLGIGLGLVKGLVELHGGHVGAESAGPGRGSRFWIALPASSVARASELAPVVADARAGARDRLRVVVVDDHRDAADSLAAVLRLAGHQVWVAYDAPSALARGAEVLPHVMTMDIGMPGMSGYEAARAIRSQPWGTGLLLVAVTGFGQDQDRDRAFAAGFSCHLTKPVDPLELERLLDSAVAPRVPGSADSLGG